MTSWDMRLQYLDNSEHCDRVTGDLLKMPYKCWRLPQQCLKGNGTMRKASREIGNPLGAGLRLSPDIFFVCMMMKNRGEKLLAKKKIMRAAGPYCPE
jgi:hypothetical protein